MHFANIQLILSSATESLNNRDDYEQLLELLTKIHMLNKTDEVVRELVKMNIDETVSNNLVILIKLVVPSFMFKSTVRKFMEDNHIDPKIFSKYLEDLQGIYDYLKGI